MNGTILHSKELSQHTGASYPTEFLKIQFNRHKKWIQGKKIEDKIKLEEVSTNNRYTDTARIWKEIREKGFRENISQFTEIKILLI